MFGVTVFLGSLLLFLVEPMAARAILTRFGGSASVWTASLLFFQLVLLAGYAWAHYGERLFGKAHRWVHVGLTLVAVAWALTSPGRAVVPAGASSESGAGEVLVALAGLVGLPFFALSANASLLQMWFASWRGQEPYQLYSASNLGSMLALLAYPSLVEPFLGLGAQLFAWGIGLLVVAVLLAVCAWSSRSGVVAAEGSVGASAGASWGQRGRWILLSAAPSSLLLGVTTYLTTNLAPVPLLWVVPLALYLLTFILAFGPRKLDPGGVGRWAPLLATPLTLALVLESSEPIVPLALFHLATFFVVSLGCHARLAAERPPAGQVTEYFLFVALGGALGGVFNAVLAPIVFPTLLEYPLALALACGLVANRTGGSTQKWFGPVLVGVGVFGVTLAIALVVRGAGMPPSQVRTLVTIGLPAVACFLVSGVSAQFGWGLAGLFVAASLMQISSGGTILLAERSFFGVHRVEFDAGHRLRKLTHGNTTHGIEALDHLDEPLTYYTRTGPIGQVFAAYPLEGASIGMVGLGVGSLAAYGKPGQRMTFYEIDPVVRRIAGDPKWFTFLSDCKARLSVVAGDGRLSVAKAPDGGFGLLVLDAFSSDTIPVHLITREAMAMYLSKLAPGGLVAYHISNRYLDLAPVLAAEARDLGVASLVGEDSLLGEEELAAGKTASKWFVVAARAGDLDPLRRDWQEPKSAARAWTDDYSNVLGAFRIGGG